ncbi:hypothetical protein WR25_18087 [Diploscapter pachys]|uniref:Uncharacterized protein n=1 Tax=Diploscapter pachys TaxID=2018661 RepID=A0A2A2JWV9_9BILA|nr:hypothetical protein WR25_18087 [Diploscapter pachys]
MCAVQAVFLDALPILGYKGCGQSGPYDHPLKIYSHRHFLRSMRRPRCAASPRPSASIPRGAASYHPPSSFRALGGLSPRSPNLRTNHSPAKTVPTVTQVYKN